MIRKKGDSFVIKSKDGKKQLGTFKTKAQATKRLREIEFFKHTKKK